MIIIAQLEGKCNSVLVHANLSSDRICKSEDVHILAPLTSTVFGPSFFKRLKRALSGS